ncbi:uncharacterized protein LOC5576709 [Aedes aegypti]|uniref:TGF-beta family profile domain-containing protein n=1 Tax=Aedes aegypti TaxID=7159 RepID=A0A903TV21_AEDAE|nr:uncharacterized protein LOC5576709 [Aedes aegypti]
MGKPVRNRQTPDTGGIYLHPADPTTDPTPETAMAKPCVNFRRTQHPALPLPHHRHSHRYPHHYQHPSNSVTSTGCRTHFGRLLSSSCLSKFLILLFLSICDNRACRTLPTLTEAASVDSSTRSTVPPILATTGSSSSSSSSSSSTPSSSSIQTAEVSSDSESMAPSASSSFNRTKLQEIVMEGLGLSEIPDVRAMNVSQQEYETKYREYLERVNRRNSLRRLLNHQQQRQPEHFETDGYDDFADEAGLAEQRFLYSFPNSDHKLNHQNLRRKRSLNNNYDLVYIRFDIPTRNASTGELTGLNSPSIYNSPSSQHHHHHQRHHQSQSELPPISPENIEESSLNIMLTRRQNSEHSTNTNSKHQQQSLPAIAIVEDHVPGQHRRRAGRIKFKHNNGIGGGSSMTEGGNAGHQRSGKSVNLHIYQLVEPYERHWLTTKTIGVAELALNDKKWFQLPLDEAVRTWLDGSRKNLGLEIYCENCYNNGIFVIHDSSPFFTSYEETPVLNVVGKLVQREKRSKVHQRYKPTMRDYLSPPKLTTCTPNNKRCCRHPLLVDLRDIEGFEYIIQPKLFDAGFCRGRCPSKFNPASHHALIQSLLHEHYKYDVPKPCCAPSRMDHIDVLHADPKNPQRLKVTTWSNMRVIECACS